ncbi:MAG TPA: DoxX family protein [Kineosporiaceae bacterium]|nr:DoxX family protein [Kineosporiaceae bacterium]
MFIATVIVSALLAAALLFSARGKLTKDPTTVQMLTGLGVPEDQLWLLALAEIAGAAGLLTGLFWWPLGVAAAVGVILYFVLAVATHVRGNDAKNAPPAAVIGLIAVGALALRLASS